MKRMHGLVGVWVVTIAFGLGASARSQDDNPFDAPVSNTAVIDDTQAAPAADDNPFGADPDDPFSAPAESPVQRKAEKNKRVAVERTARANRDAVVLSGNVQSKPASSNARVREALASPTRMEFTEMPLIDAVDYLKDFHSIEIQLDNPALEDAGLGSDTPVTRTLNGLPLSSSLRLLLEEHGLTFLVRDGVLMITTKSAARDYLELKVYDVSKLVGEDAKATEVAAALAQLRQPKPLAASNGPTPDNFTVVPFRNLLIIRASQHDHEELDKLFAEMKPKLGPSD